MSSYDGINALARLLQERMKAVGKEPPALDFATVKSADIFRLDAYELDIPMDDLVRMKGAPVLSVGDRIVIAFVGDEPLLVGVLEV
jgi:hypothetical protein